jgi:hypothetical protein
VARAAAAAAARFGARDGTGASRRTVDARVVQLALLASQARGTRRPEAGGDLWRSDTPRRPSAGGGSRHSVTGRRREAAGATCFRAKRGSSASRTVRAHDSAPAEGGRLWLEQPQLRPLALVRASRKAAVPTGTARDTQGPSFRVREHEIFPQGPWFSAVMW